MHIDKASFITAFKLGTWFWAVRPSCHFCLRRMGMGNDNGKGFQSDGH